GQTCLQRHIVLSGRAHHARLHAGSLLQERSSSDHRRCTSMPAKKEPASATRSAGERRLKRSQGFVEEVFGVIRADILSLRIPPDTRISIDSLARELGVSQTPIREALSMLEAIGLVTKRHFVGYCSAPQLNRKQLDELYEVRLLIEPYAARCAAERMSAEELEKLRKLAESMKPGESRSSYNR